MKQLFFKHKRIFIAAAIILAVLIALFSFCAAYLNDYYHADVDAITAFCEGGSADYSILDDGTIVFEPEEAVAGLIFYPGGKVEHTSYIPLMQACSDKGILCVIVEMPFNLAVFDINAADGIREKFPKIEKWYIGGHSLGGAMAAQYLSDNGDDFDGLVLLGAYAASDLSKTDLSVLSVYGSEDKVLDMEKYEVGKGNIPEEFFEVVIDGGCHAYFGMYGPQKGDGTPEISCKEQIEATAQEISKLVFSISENGEES